MINLQPYIVPRPFNGYNIPGAIQSSYLKNYVTSKKLRFSLPIVEITTSSSFYLLKGYINKNKHQKIDICVVSGFVFPIYEESILNELFSDYVSIDLNIHMVLEAKVLNIKEFYTWANNVREINQFTHSYDDKNVKKNIETLKR